MKKQPSYKARTFIEAFQKKINRQVAGSFKACARCGACTESCHYMLADPSDPSYAPVVKAEKIRKLFNRHVDWTGRVFPWWVGAESITTDEDLEELKDVVFGKCTNCRRCSINCPMGVDFATMNRMVRGLLVSVGVMPEGVRVVSKDQWEIGNQMGVLPEDYLGTLEWQAEELAEELADNTVTIPVDKENADVVYALNPREIKYDPRSVHDAAKIFHLAKENWTVSSEGWDMTNFGLFSGDDTLGGTVARRVYESVIRLKGKKLVIAECGHGYRSTACEGPNWAKMDIPFPMESMIITMSRYIDEGRIVVDPSVNKGSYTYHDSCNLARSCGMFEEPRELLRRVVPEFREMYPNRAENFCCTGGGGAMSMSEYTPRRLKSAKVKAEQLKATGADFVVTSCHNCVDGLTDLIKHYKLNIKVVQLVQLVADAAVVKTEHKAAPLSGKKILVIDDESDTIEFLTIILQDHGAEVLSATDGAAGIRIAREAKPNLITLDLSMPGQDGGDIFCAIRNDAALADMKVCIITGRPEMRRLVYERPVRRPEGYVNKPFTEEILIHNVRKILDC
jgi:Fe-S oxidoreductase/CheY-like chemotaxis protein